MGRHRFSDELSESLRQELDALVVTREFGRGEIVFHEGDPAAAIHLVESGWFLAHLQPVEGDRVGLTIEGPGDVFGELALLRPGGRRSATIKALRPGVTRSLDVEPFTDLREKCPELDRLLLTHLTARIMRLSRQLSEAAWTRAEVRICRQVIRLYTVFDEGPIQLSQSELASLAHTTRPTVSSLFGRLARQGVVETGRGYVNVLDLDKLQAEA